MAYPTAAGIRNIQASTMRYVPEIWSGKLLISFYTRTVLAAICNVDWEGEIKDQGDTVYIRSIPAITINDHQKGQALAYEQPVATPVTLLIDKGKSWSFSTNLVDDVQTDIKDYTSKWTDDAGKRLKIAVDKEVVQNVYSSAHASNYGATAGAISGDIDLGVDGGTSVSLTKANVLDKIVECGQVLDEQSVPEDAERWMVVPAWMCSIIKLSDLKNASITGDSVSPLRNGRIGEIDTFTIYKSNQLATTTDGAADTATCIIFGTKHAIAFASQLIKSETLPNPFAFGHYFRGLQVFGYKVVKPQALGWLYAKKG